MPPKRNTRAAPAAAAAVVAGGGEAPTATATAADRNGRRRAREEPAEEQRFVRARQEVAEVRKWEWSSPVSDILLHRIDPKIGETKLRDFIREHFREDYPIEHIDNYAMDVVVANPNRFIPQELLGDVEPLEAFQLLRDAYLLEQRGIVTLRQWRDFGEKDIVSLSSQEILNGVRVQITEILQGGQILTGLYESLYGAKWDYVVKSPCGDPDRFWLEVKDGSSSPQEWTDTEVEYLTPAVNDADARRYNEERENECKEDEDNVKPTRELLQMKVLTSTQGWPYNLSSKEKNRILDCHITKEVERAWRLIKGDLHEWFDDPSRSRKKPRKRVLIGTPGIGKSMAVGSYLLYQLLHYNGERLPVVAYFISDEMYIFDKTTRQVTMYDAVKDFAIVKQLARKCDGYTILDCSEEIVLPATTLPELWGTTLISSPNGKNFKVWEKHRSTTKIVVNCPITADLKAMHMWKQCGNNNTEDILSGWAVIKECAEDLGPLPRFVFNRTTSEDRKKIVNDEIRNITGKTADRYARVFSEVWHTESPCHKLAMIFRESTSIPHRMDFYRNAPLSEKIKCSLTLRSANQF